MPSKEDLARLVRKYLHARDEFDACNIVAEPRRSNVAARALEVIEARLREVVEIPGNPGVIDDPAGEPLFSWVGDTLTECGLKLRTVEERMREVPTARHCADRVAELCARIDEVAEEFANEDHMGNK
jgi:hypothetical protein